MTEYVYRDERAIRDGLGLLWSRLERTAPRDAELVLFRDPRAHVRERYTAEAFDGSLRRHHWASHRATGRTAPEAVAALIATFRLS